MTVADLIKGSLRLIGAIATSETPSAAESADALLVLNDMLESWANDGMLIYQSTPESLALVAAQQTYTMGLTGNFNTARPTRINKANVMLNNIEVPVEILNEQQWAEITQKSMTAQIPSKLYTDGAFPLLNVKVWPIPTEVNNLVLYSLKPITAFSSTATTVSLPPGYSRALRYNLAGELCPEYGKAVDPVIAGIASDSRAEIKRQNTKPVYMKSDASGLPTSGKSFNIYTGE